MENNEPFLRLAETALRHKLGEGARLKPKQVEVLAQLAAKRNCFASLPTGYGKSLCYWLPALAWGWRIWVLCPLVALIEDQAAACSRLGLRTLKLHASGEGEAEIAEAQVIFLTPERLEAWRDSGVISWLEANGILPDLFVMDEMHCLEEWREFREGLKAACEPIRRVLGAGARLLGLSASFASTVRDEWMRELTDDYALVIAGLGRKRLVLRIFPLEDGSQRWLMLTSCLRGLEAPESSLVYCATREECDATASWLRSAGIEAVAYHAGHPASIRLALSEAFRAGRLRVVCATAAFGMGIDYPHVSRVIHFSLPYDLGAYWQEAGRAGRAGQLAYSIVLWRRSEISRLRVLPQRARERHIELWRALIAGDCRKRAIAGHLGMSAARCGVCDRCAPEGKNLPDWLRECVEAQQSAPWWLRETAEPLRWLEEKSFSLSEKS